MYLCFVGTLVIRDLLATKRYYNIVVMLMAMEGNFKYLVEWLGEPGALAMMKKIKYYMEFSQRMGSLDNYPIALTPCGNIWIDHYQVASAILVGYSTIGYIQKRIDCEVHIFDEAWARTTFSNFDEVESFYCQYISK